MIVHALFWSTRGDKRLRTVSCNYMKIIFSRSDDFSLGELFQYQYMCTTIVIICTALLWMRTILYGVGEVKSFAVTLTHTLTDRPYLEVALLWECQVILEDVLSDCFMLGPIVKSSNKCWPSLLAYIKTFYYVIYLILSIQKKVLWFTYRYRLVQILKLLWLS